MRLNHVVLAMVSMLILLSICLLFSKQIIQPAGMFLEENRNVDGTVTFTVRTVSYGGTYATHNAGAIWITNSSDQFVKTVKIWAQQYRSKLVKWVQSSGNNTTGAITSASLNSHQLHTVTWNGTNSSSVAVPDGDYKVNVEFAEHNATASNSGKYKVITFTKGIDAVDITPANETYFTTMHLVWAPVAPADGTISGTITDAQSLPIEGAIITAGSNTTTSASNGDYSLSLLPGTYTLSCEATGFVTQSQTNVTVQSNQNTVSNFILGVVSNSDDSYITEIPVLKQNVPNPFRNSTVIGFYSDKEQVSNLNIYNSKGQKVRTLSLSSGEKGWQQVMWDGTNNAGKKLTAGKYYYKLETNKKTLTKIATILN